MRTMRMLLVAPACACDFGLGTDREVEPIPWFLRPQRHSSSLHPAFNEMETVGSTADVQIIVQFDRSPRYDESNGNWTDTRRYRVVQDLNSTTISSPVVQNIGEVNMGDPQSLVDFVQWAKQNYPADHYCLVLWDHGGGWKAARTSLRDCRATLSLISELGALGDL